MDKTTKPTRVRNLVLWLLTSFAMAIVLLYFLHRPSFRVVQQWQQPGNLKYDDRGPYYLSIVERDLDWSGFPLYVERNYFLYLGRDAGTPSHGHMLKFSFHPSVEDLYDLPASLRKAVVQWTSEGVEITFDSGHRLFVPEDMFTGGR